MVYRKRHTNKGKRKTFRPRHKKGKYRKNNPSQVIVRQPSGFPDRFYTKLYFSNNGVYTGTSPYKYTFRGNSLYDPDETGVGGQPTYFDQLMGLYTYFTVLGSKINVELVNQAQDPCFFTVVPVRDASFGTSDPTELPYNITKLLEPKGTGGIVRFFKQYMTTRKMYGIKTNNQVMSNIDSFSGTVSSNPSSSWKWNLYWNDTLVGTITSFVKIRITYYVCFHVRVSIADS